MSGHTDNGERRLTALLLFLAILPPVVFPCFSNAAETPVAESGAIQTAGRFLELSVATQRTLHRRERFLPIRPGRTVQIAYVIDSSAAMSAEIDYLKKQPTSLLRLLETNGSSGTMAVVVYRNRNHADGAVSWRIPTFTADPQSISQCLLDLEADSQSNHREPSIDQAVYEAIARLDWSPVDAANRDRWLLLWGSPAPNMAQDAPETGSSDQHTLRSLVDAARSKGIRVFALLVRAEPAVPPGEMANSASRRDVRGFMRSLAAQTGGKFVDLQDPLQVNYWWTFRGEIEPITVEEIQSLSAPGQMPHTPHPIRLGVTEEVDSPQDNNHAGSSTSAATELRRWLEHVPGLQVVDGWRPADSPATLKDSADASKPDFLITVATKKLFDRQVLQLRLLTPDGVHLASERTCFSGDRSDAMIRVSALMLRLFEQATAALKQQDKTDLARRLRNITAKANPLKEIRATLACDPRAQDEIAAGLELLESTLIQPHRRETGEHGPAADERLALAIRRFENARVIDHDNPFACLMTAHCYYSLSQLRDEPSLRSIYDRFLTFAHEVSQSRYAPDHPLRTEIEAEFQLMIRRDPTTAMRLYETLASYPDLPGMRFALRAHWMLAGIQLGDWLTVSDAPQVIDVSRARQHVLHILAFWPDSVEAEFYRAQLQDSTNPSHVAVNLGLGRLPSWLPLPE